jgi:hypothetical protein
VIKIFTPDEFKAEHVRKAGAEDGSKDIPGQADTEVAPFERQLVDRGQQVMREFEGAFRDVEARLKERFFAAREDFRRADALYAEKYAKHERPVAKKIATWLYLLALVVIVLVELPVNYAALSALGDAPIFVMLLATLLGAAFMIAAHLIGMTIRHKGANFGTVASIVLVCGIIGFLAYLRATYFLHPEEVEDVGQVLRNIDARALAAMFGLMNVLFFVIACWLSFLAHDEDEHYAQITSDRNRLRAKVEALQTERGRECAAIQARARDYIELVHSQINEYRRANQAARTSNAVPDSWRTHTPEKLLELTAHDFDPLDNTLFQAHGESPK